MQLIFASHRFDDFVPADHAPRDAARRPHRRTRRRPAAAAGARRARPATGARGATRTPAPPIVEIRHADVFRGTTHVLHNIDWSIRAGEHTAIFGANGSGKSTFASVVAGTLAPVYGGEVLRFGATRTRSTCGSIKETIAHVSEEWQVAFDVNHTVEEVVLSGFASSVGLFHEPDAGAARDAPRR